MAISVFETLAKYRVVPISTGGLDASNADAVGDALVAAGLPLLEVTLRSPGALAAAERLARRGDMLISTGTVLTLDQAKASLDAGVHYLVAPGLDMKLVEWSQRQELPIVPGATTATEITHAYTAGLRVVKFFPAEVAGGVDAMNALAGPFAGLRFMPTGGITIDMFDRYLGCRHVVAVGQGAMLKPDWLKAGNFEQVRAEAERAATAAAGVAIA